VDPAEMYARYCALCHGADREGYAADNAPSLRSPELLGAGRGAFIKAAIAYGRPGTPMAAFIDTQGGPLDQARVNALHDWLVEGVPAADLATAPIGGDVTAGAALYGARCAACHGALGEGGTGPALRNPVYLATASDAQIRDAIARGRTGTPMAAFSGELSGEQLDALTAYLRSRATGWEAPSAVRVRPPPPERAVQNLGAPAAKLDVRDGMFVPADQVQAALARGERIVLLDARPMSDWQRGHLPGAVPVPFYDDVGALVPHLPNDETFIVAYCACPHAASGKVARQLRQRGFERAVVLDEGSLVWAQRGYPLVPGDASR
jgi:mono/diheme cytochrome c family protein/rhodanese-related sulfurtransferase